MGFDTPEEVIADFNLREHYVDSSKRQELLDNLSKFGEVTNFQAQLTNRDGTPFWCEISSRWYPEEEFLETVAIDITAKKETEMKLKKSEEQFRNIFESTPRELTQPHQIFPFPINTVNTIDGRLHSWDLVQLHA